MFDNVRRSVEPLSPVTGRIICVFPSIKHVKALQKLLGTRISQEAPIGWEELHRAPEDFPDMTRLVFLESNSVGETLLALPAKSSFLSHDTFVMADGRLFSLRDQSGQKWGVNGGLSEDVFKGFQEVFDSLEEPNEG